MFSRVVGHIRRQPVAVVALFVAMSTGAAAASTYVLTSVAQIKPSVRTALLPRVYAVFNNGPVQLGTSYTSVATMAVPRGTYAIDAKAVAFGGGTTTALCKLNGGTDFDISAATVTAGSSASVALEVTHTFTSAGIVNLSCLAYQDSQARLDAVKVDAIRVGPLRLQPVTS